MHRKVTVMVPEGARCAIVPPQADPSPHKPGIGSANATPEQCVDKPAANETRTINAARGLTAPIVSDTLVSLETGEIVRAEEIGWWVGARW